MNAEHAVLVLQLQMYNAPDEVTVLVSPSVQSSATGGFDEYVLFFAVPQSITEGGGVTGVVVHVPGSRHTIPLAVFESTCPAVPLTGGR